MTVPAVAGRLSLGDVRGRLAAVLAPATDDDPDVTVDVVDSVTPPAILLLWDDPWLTPETYKAIADRGYWTARIEVLCIASRVEPGPGVEKLEDLVSFVIGRTQADSYSWPAGTVSAPRVFTIGGVPYLGSRITYQLPVSV